MNKTINLRLFLSLALLSYCIIATTQIRISEGIIEIDGPMGDEPAGLKEISVIDTAFLECIYEYTVQDKILNQTKTLYDILQVGGNYTKYHDYAGFCVDSVRITDNITDMTTREYFNLRNKYIREGSPCVLLKDLSSQVITQTEQVFADVYTFADSLRLDWAISDDTALVCGYPCRKAEAGWRGRHWTAWYAEDIPVSAGPYKFSGLPGLILRMEDADKEHIFEAISIRKAESGIYPRESSMSYRVAREEFNKIKKEHKEDPGSFMTGPLAPTDPATGKPSPIPKKRLFFNPIELE